MFAIHAHLEQKEFEQAWKLFDTTNLSTHIPRSTSNELLMSLYTQVHSHLSQLFLEHGQLAQLYLKRLETLTGLVRQSHITPWNTQEFCTVLELYGRLNQLARAESVFRNHGHYVNTPLTVEMYNTMLLIHVRRFRYMDELTQRRCLSKLKTLEIEMTRKGLMNTTSWNLLLAAQVKSHYMEGAEKIFKKITKPDRTTYNILLNGYLKECKNNKDKALSSVWMEKVIQSGVRPNKKTFISIMDGLAGQVIRHAHLKEFRDMDATTHSVTQLHKTMLQSGHQTDTETINTLLKCYTAANDFKLIENLVEKIRFPEKKGGCGNCGCASKALPTPTITPKIEPDAFTFNMLIYHYLKNENTDKAFEMYDTMMQLELSPDTTTYAEFIGHYARTNNIEEACKYVDVMRRKGIPFNNFIYNMLLNASLQHPEKAHLLQPHLKAMLIDQSATLDTISQNTLLARFDVLDDNIDTSFDNYSELLAQTIFATDQPLTTRTYNTVLHSSGPFYKEKSIVASLDKIMQALEISNVHPDVYTFALSLRNATWAGDMIKAEQIYKDMSIAGVQPNAYVFSHLIYGYAQNGNMEKAEGILRGMSAAPFNIEPTALNYAPLIHGYAENTEYDKAHGLFREMMERDIKPDLVIYTILARMFIYSDNEKGAIDLLEGYGKVSVDAASLTVLAEAYAKQETPNVANVAAIYSLLKKNQWLDSKAMTTLLKSYDLMRYPEGAWEIWNEFNRDNRRLNTFHYNALLTCLTKQVKAWYPATKSVYQQLMQSSHLKPDRCTFDLMIWGAYTVCDYDMIRSIWQHVDREKPLMTKNYLALMTAMVAEDCTDDARLVFQAFASSSERPPASAKVWEDMIYSLAIDQGFIEHTHIT